MRCLVVYASMFLALCATRSARAEFDLIVTINNPNTFTPTQLSILETAAAAAELVWERVITGYQPGITRTELPVGINGVSSGFANARVNSSVTQGGFNLATSGSVNINRGILEEFSDFEVDAEVAEYPGQRVNVIDELIAHEIGHVLGFGTKWTSLQNGQRAYSNGTGRYVGHFGLAAYRDEFDQPDAQFVPVELGGGAGSANSHWDQFFRSAEGPAGSDPFELDPRLGIVDEHGRDLGLELMTGAIDPDWGEPFLSRTTVQSLRDLGFTVVPEPATWGLCLVAAGLGGLVRFRV